ncbi:MAG: DUF2336 domain-containing protein [Alphaproteobacteria bacterium]|nr:DUF2336 domain-containing protein [Alphaproteobacteria bacterium]MDE2336637.1 DUF2336 domain-containing protein [Alphaproteobacteria bacterium]
MLKFLKKMFARDKKLYERQKLILASGTPAERLQIAENADTHPEALYFLAKDADPNVRRAVAVNKSTPVQASALLANDKSPDVRLALAARLVELLPDLSAEKHGQLYAYAVQALSVLAHDEVLKIRSALSTALKDHAKAPPKVVGQLARDVEREVSEPILRFCLALSDEDLLEILADHPSGWAVAAVANRPAVSPRVSEAVIGANDIPASLALIKNKGAQFTKELLLKIIEKSRDYPDWHEDIAVRKELSLDLAQRFAGFVSQAVLDVLARRDDFDPETRAEIADIVKRRIAFRGGDGAEETPEAKLARYVKAGHLTPGVITDALSWNDHKFVLLALSGLSGIHPIVVEKMLGAGSAKPIVALCWKAGLPMRVAVELQHSYAHLPPRDFMYAKGGTDYPMSPTEIKWQLEFYGVDLK